MKTLQKEKIKDHFERVSEMVIKGAQMGIPFLLSRSGVTKMGVEMARKVDLALFGRCSGKHFLLFSGFKRFVPELID